MILKLHYFFSFFFFKIKKSIRKQSLILKIYLCSYLKIYKYNFKYKIVKKNCKITNKMISLFIQQAYHINE